MMKQGRWLVVVLVVSLLMPILPARAQSTACDEQMNALNHYQNEENWISALYHVHRALATCEDVTGSTR